MALEVVEKIKALYLEANKHIPPQLDVLLSSAEAMDRVKKMDISDGDKKALMLTVAIDTAFKIGQPDKSKFEQGGIKFNK